MCLLFAAALAASALVVAVPTIHLRLKEINTYNQDEDDVSDNTNRHVGHPGAHDAPLAELVTDLDLLDGGGGSDHSGGNHGDGDEGLDELHGDG